MNYKLFLIAFFSLKAFAMGCPSDQAPSTAQGNPTTIRPLEIISADCRIKLTMYAFPDLIRKFISEFKTHPEKEFAHYWIENREDMVGSAKAAMISAGCLYNKEHPFALLERACINKELIKTFDKYAMKVVKAYINHTITPHSLPLYSCTDHLD